MEGGYEGEGEDSGATGRIRTDDLLITNQLLYQLSYGGKFSSRSILRKFGMIVNRLLGSYVIEQSYLSLDFKVTSSKAGAVIVEIQPILVIGHRRNRVGDVERVG
jgi:hypothetical protein